MCSVNCCYQCTDRHGGCHSTCEKYIKSKAAYEEEKRLIREKKSAYNEMISYQKSLKLKYKHR